MFQYKVIHNVLPTRAALYLVQSLNSPFFPPHMGAEPVRAKEESGITCMCMLRTPPFFPPNLGKNHIWKYFPDFACGVIMRQATISDWLKTCQLTDPKSVEFYQCHAKPHWILFFTTISKTTKEISVNIC